MKVFNDFQGGWLQAFGKLLLVSDLAPISKQLKNERKTKTIYPSKDSALIFKAFELTPFDKVKVIILGQDPYHGGAFNGLAFGNGTPNNPPATISPSLKTIEKELKKAYPDNPESLDYSLYSWAKQGVLLINTAFTVVEGTPGSHLILWKPFTEHVLTALNFKDDIVWMLWGRHAQSYTKFCTNRSHYIIKTGHPSPLNRSNPFVGSGCFLECNQFLIQKGQSPIEWLGTLKNIS